MDNEIDRSKGQWFVLHTLSGQENRVKENLEKQIRLEDAALPVYEVLIPMEKVAEVRNGKKSYRNHKFFPGYVLIRMDLYHDDKSLNEAAWYFVREVQGVISFVGGGDHPQPLSPAEVEDMLRQSTPTTEEKAKPKIQYEIGETLRIKDGAFENFEGVVNEIDNERGKLRLMVSIFGRSTPVELEFWQVGRDE